MRLADVCAHVACGARGGEGTEEMGQTKLSLLQLIDCLVPACSRFGTLVLLCVPVEFLGGWVGGWAAHPRPPRTLTTEVPTLQPKD